MEQQLLDFMVRAPKGERHPVFLVLLRCVAQFWAQKLDFGPDSRRRRRQPWCYLWSVITLRTSLEDGGLMGTGGVDLHEEVAALVPLTCDKGEEECPFNLNFI